VSHNLRNTSTQVWFDGKTGTEFQYVVAPSLGVNLIMIFWLLNILKFKISVHTRIFIVPLCNECPFPPQSGEERFTVTVRRLRLRLRLGVTVQLFFVRFRDVH
jgi:hypothetical protein